MLLKLQSRTLSSASFQHLQCSQLYTLPVINLPSTHAGLAGRLSDNVRKCHSKLF